MVTCFLSSVIIAQVKFTLSDLVTTGIEHIVTNEHACI